MRFVTHASFSNSPEWRAIYLAAMLDDGLEARVIHEADTITALGLLDAVPVGSVEFCTAVARAQGIVMPSPLDYPEPLVPYLRRNVHQGVLAEAAGFFAKPVQTKAFEAFLAPSCADDFLRMLADRRLDPGTPCWLSEHISFMHEWRVYVAQHHVLGVAQYDLDDEDAKLEATDFEMVREMIETWSGAPCAYALDVGRTDRGILALVEVNDGWGTGYYPSGSLRPADFARWCAARWTEMSRQS